ncbi:MAG: exodeoxyribonuclease I [Pseudomonadota bacterium]
MAGFSFYWHDYETFGVVPRRDRPAQFAGVRTDADLNEIEAPLTLYCQPSPDTLPEPEACLITGITPQRCAERGVSERAFAEAIEGELARPGTVGCGYNSLRFDDEVTRFLFWRCLIDPYAREWQNECGRWDLLDCVRCAWALRPEGIVWPQREAGKPSFRLEHLTAANGLAHEAAHDALSDVRATIGLARLVKTQQPKLWAHCLKLHRKQAVIDEMGVGRPFVHLSGRYPVERGCMAVVWPLAPHPYFKNEVIVWDLAHDPSELFQLNGAEIRARLFTAADALPAGQTRLPIKTIHLNKSPIVIGNLKTLGDAAQRWGIDVVQAQRHAEVAARQANSMAGIWPEVYERGSASEPVDVDEDLYGGFLDNDDRRALQRLRTQPPERLAERRPAFNDTRLDELLLRFRARNHPGTLSAEERGHWRAHCRERWQALPAWLERIAALEATADARGRALLSELRHWSQSMSIESESETA